MGASTTANVLSYKENNYSYPILLEQQIHRKLNKNIEVNNCGVGGYTSSDILISYALNVIETNPDYVINSLSELPQIINHINSEVSTGN